MKKAIALMSIAISLALPGAASAHGGAARHGAIVKSAGGLSFELVSKDGALSIGFSVGSQRRDRK